MKKIAFITSSRADWNGLGMVAKAFHADPRFDAHVIATGQMVEAGLTDLVDADSLVPRIARAGIPGDTRRETVITAATAMAAIRWPLSEIGPDMAVLCGDRYEILSAAFAASLMGIPIAHLSGGDVTEGSLDDKFRNAITMLADLHFPTNDKSGSNIRWMTRKFSNVHVVGAPALDRIRATPVTMTKAEFCASVGLDPDDVNVLVAFHPVTTDAAPAAQCWEMVEALGRHPRIKCLALGVNADAGSSEVEAMLRSIDGVIYRHNLPPELYYAALTYCDLMVGNSSAGLYETPSFGIPVVNVGNRQEGRIVPANVETVPARGDDIDKAIGSMLALGRHVCSNPYGDGHASERIVEHVARYLGLAQ